MFGIFRKRPPVGSTDWAAQQFLGMLDREEREKAERQRLRQAGWQPAEPPVPADTDEPGFDDGRDAVADLVQRDIDYRRALSGEARRRLASSAASAFGQGTPTRQALRETAQYEEPLRQWPFEAILNDPVARDAQISRYDGQTAAFVDEPSKYDRYGRGKPTPSASGSRLGFLETCYLDRVLHGPGLGFKVCVYRCPFTGAELIRRVPDPLPCPRSVER